MKKDSYIDLKVPSIMGMGAVGPTLALITATLYSALCVAMDNPPSWTYPIIMLVLSALLSVFPVTQAPYPKWQRFCLWPVTAAIVFSTAWGTNHGLSVGEEAISNADIDLSWYCFPMTSTVYAGPEDAPPVPVKSIPVPILNNVDFSKVLHDTKTLANQKLFAKVSKTTWAMQWPNSNEVYLKEGSNGIWYKYLLRKKASPKPISKPSKAQHHGFFKRF